jgi:hypothetical protein
MRAGVGGDNFLKTQIVFATLLQQTPTARSDAAPQCTSVTQVACAKIAFTPTIQWCV